MAFNGNKSVIRQSKYRHAYAEISPFKYDDVKSPARASVEGCFGLTASEALIACPSPAGGASGAGLMFIPVDNTQINRLLPQSVVSLHNGCGISDYDFDPFRAKRIATAGEDGLVKLWDIPETASSVIKEPLLVLEGNSKKVTFIKYNPVVDNLLATAANDGAVMCFDAETRKSILRTDCKEMCQSLEWDFFGNALCGVFKDKAIRIVDPRHQAVALETLNSHKGNKAAKAVWLCNRNQPTDSGTYITSCGFSDHTKRETFLWDTRNFSEPCWTNSIDENSGIIYPYFDECTGLLLLVGRGDGNIRYYEFSDSNIYYLNDYRSSSPQRGFTLFPKRVVDQDRNEVIRCLKMENTTIQTMSFLVPRRMDACSADLYPSCPNGKPAIASAAAWMCCDADVAPATSETPAVQVPVVSQHIPAVEAPLSDGSIVLKQQIAALTRTNEEQAKKIARLEAIVMSVETPVKSPSPKKSHENFDELRTEVTILKDKVVKLMNENARLRMTFQNNKGPVVAVAGLPMPPHPVARSGKTS